MRYSPSALLCAINILQYFIHVPCLVFFLFLFFSFSYWLLGEIYYYNQHLLTCGVFIFSVDISRKLFKKQKKPKKNQFITEICEVKVNGS